MENKPENFKLIPLTQGKFAVIDGEDYDRLSQYTWYVAKSGSTFYACRVRGHTTVHIHREIMRAAEGMICDHKNHKGLDNRKSNLRLCTSSQNARNQQARAGCTSKYKGVCWHKKHKKWQARIACNSSRMHLGSFDNEIDAALAYDRRAIEVFGEFAWLNFPERIELRNWIRKIIWAA
jgi:hypothetical protein